VGRAGKAVVWALAVGLAAALAGVLLMKLSDPVSLGSGAGVMLLVASPLMAIGMGAAMLLAGRPKRVVAARAAERADDAKEPQGAPPLPSVGHVRLGYYKFKMGYADAVAHRMQAEMRVLYDREPGFIALHVVRCGADELLSISQWETRYQAEAAVEREIRWMRSTAPSAVLQTDSHVGGIVVSERR
jgi:heme-degrading monooxygenase HmoA